MLKTIFIEEDSKTVVFTLEDQLLEYNIGDKLNLLFNSFDNPKREVEVSARETDAIFIDTGVIVRVYRIKRLG